MSTIVRWLDDLARLPDLQGITYTPLAVRHVAHPLTRADLAGALAGLGPVTGWLQETGRVVAHHAEGVVLQGVPLAGEWCNGSRHWILEHGSGESWWLHAFTAEPCAAEAATHLGETVSHLRTGQPGRRLRYWRLWSSDATLPGQPPVATLALFTGFED